MSAIQSAAIAQQAPSARGSAALWVLIALFVLGIVSLVFGLNNEQLDFPLLTASFLYLMGISQAGVVFCCFGRLVKAQWAKPYYRLAELSTVAFFPFAIAIFLLLYTSAQDELFYWLAPTDEHLSPWLNINWLFARDFIGLLVFYGVSVLYAMKALKPDLASKDAVEADHRRVEGELYLWSPVVLIAFIVCNTFFAWDFAMMLIPHWHSTVFPIFYWFGNIFAATAAMIIFPILLGRSNSSGSEFGPDQTRFLGMMVTAFTLMWLYFFWAQFFVIWFGNLPHESEPLWRQMYGHYSPYYWTMMAGCFFIPFVTLIFAVVKRSRLAMGILALGINLGIWMSKYLMVVPVFSPDHRPFGNWVDIGVAVGLAAGFGVVLLLLVRRVPIYSRWEMALKPVRRR